MKFTSYWLDTSPPGPDRSGSELGGHVDVAVVGAGLTGLSAALHLARKGANVHVLERETVAAGAAGRHGAMGTPGMSLGCRDTAARYESPPAGSLYMTYYDAIDTVEKLVADERIDCDFARTGRMILAAKPSHMQGLRRTHEILAERLGVETRLVPRGQLSSEIGSDRYHGAMLDPRDAGLHVGKFSRGLAESAARVGAVIHENAPVVGVRRLAGTEHELLTPRGSVRADQILFASSGYASRRNRWQQVRLASVGNLIIVTEPLGTDVCDSLLPKRRMAADTKNLLCHFRITPDHRLLFGGRARFAISNRPSADMSGRIPQAMVSIFPQVAQSSVDYCWGGLVDMSVDWMVHAGEHKGLYSLRCSGLGVQMATHLGKQMAEFMNGNREDIPGSTSRSSGSPGHVGPPGFLAFPGVFYRPSTPSTRSVCRD